MRRERQLLTRVIREFEWGFLCLCNVVFALGSGEIGGCNTWTLWEISGMCGVYFVLLCGFWMTLASASAQAVGLDSANA